MTSKNKYIGVYFQLQIGTGPVPELNMTFCPVLELGCLGPQCGNVQLVLCLALGLGLGKKMRRSGTGCSKQSCCHIGDINIPIPELANSQLQFQNWASDNLESNICTFPVNKTPFMSCLLTVFGQLLRFLWELLPYAEKML
jgi:hypothetical protein